MKTYSPKVGKLNTKITPNVLFLIIGVTVVMGSSLFAAVDNIGLGYSDEVFCVVCALILPVYIVKHKRVHTFYFFLAALVALGLLGNLFTGVQPNFGIAITDAFIFCKPYILLLYIILTVKESEAKTLYAFFTVISKVIVVILFIFCIASVFWNLNMLNHEGDFEFLSGFTGTASMWTILSLAVIASNENNNRLFYFILSAIIVFRTYSGLGTLSIVGFIAIYLFLEKQKKFKWYYLLIIIPVCLWTGRNEIIGYLMDRNAPRFMLFYYSFVTAFRYFPLGAGFATYGSTVAVSNYSSLYYKYGFNHKFGMGVEDNNFLMDSYYPQIIGQLGFVGTVIFGSFMYLFFRKMVWEIKNKYVRNASLYLYATWAVAGLGFGIASSWGCTVYVVLAMLYVMEKVTV